MSPKCTSHWDFHPRQAQFFPFPDNPMGAGIYAEVGTAGVGRNEDWTHGEVVGRTALVEDGLHQGGQRRPGHILG